MKFYLLRLKILGIAFSQFCISGLLLWIGVMDQSSKSNFFFWIAPICFSVMGVMSLWPLFQNGPTLVLDEKGITDRSSFGLIVWEDIKSLSIEIGWRPFLCVEVQNLSRYLLKVSPIKRFFLQGGPIQFLTIRIDFFCISPGLDEAWKYIEKTYPEKVKKELDKDFLVDNPTLKKFFKEKQ